MYSAGSAPPVGAPLRPRTIVWAAQGTREERSAARLVAELAMQHLSVVRIVHVAERLDTPAREERRIGSLKLRTRALRAQGIDASLHVVRGAVGPVAHAILEVAGAAGADLLIVSTREGLRSHGLRRPTAEQLLERATCPVLAVRGAADPQRTIRPPVGTAGLHR